MTNELVDTTPGEAAAENPAASDSEGERAEDDRIMAIYGSPVIAVAPPPASAIATAPSVSVATHMLAGGAAENPAASDPKDVENPFDGKTPQEFLDACEAQRRAELPDSELYSLDSAHDLQQSYDGCPRPFSDVVTIVPPGWTRGKLITEARFKESRVGPHHHNFGPCVRDSVDAEFVAAGGAPAFLIKASSPNTLPLRGTRNEPGDVDYYIVSDTENTSASCGAMVKKFTTSWATTGADEIQADPDLEEYIDAEWEPAAGFSLNTGVLEFSYGFKNRYSYSQDSRMRTSQLIMRGPYKTKGAIPAGFDLGASSVLVDKNGVSMTLRGLFSSVFDVELVDPRARSTSFGTRLQKYFERGYGLALAGLSPEHVEAARVSGEVIKLEDLHIRILAVSEQEPNMWEAHISVVNAGAKSDYAPYHNQIDNGELHDIVGYRDASDHLFQNAYRGLTALNRMVKEPEYQPRWGISRMYITDSIQSMSEIMATLEDCVSTLLMGVTVGGLLTEDDIAKFMDRSWVKSVLRQYRVPSRSVMVKVLGMEESAYSKLCVRVCAAWQNPAITSVVIEDAIAPWVDALHHNYARLKDTNLKWWLQGDPGRQWWTASLNPARIELSEWYLDCFDPVRYERIMSAAHHHVPPPVDPVKEATPVREKKIELKTEFECGLCYDKVPISVPHAQLPCGHTFCWMFNGDCVGLTSWIAQGSVSWAADRTVHIEKACPMCASPMVPLPAEPDTPEAGGGRPTHFPSQMSHHSTFHLSLDMESVRDAPPVAVILPPGTNEPDEDGTITHAPDEGGATEDGATEDGAAGNDGSPLSNVTLTSII